MYTIFFVRCDSREVEFNRSMSVDQSPNIDS